MDLSPTLINIEIFFNKIEPTFIVNEKHDFKS
jgi:hypothetical protein